MRETVYFNDDIERDSLIGEYEVNGYFVETIMYSLEKKYITFIKQTDIDNRILLVEQTLNEILLGGL